MARFEWRGSVGTSRGAPQGLGAGAMEGFIPSRMVQFEWRSVGDADLGAPQGLGAVAAEGFIPSRGAVVADGTIPSRYRINSSPVVRCVGIANRVVFYICFFVFCLPVLARAAEPDSLSVLRNAVAQSPKDGEAWVQLGYAYVAADSLDQAEDAFRKGERYAGSARALNGRGLVMMKKGISQARIAFPYFRQALSKDPGYIEAQLNIARTHVLLREPAAEGAYRDVIAIDSTYAPVYLELAQWYLHHGYEVYPKELMDLYRKYMALRPKSPEGYYGLALTYTSEKDYGSVLDVALQAIRAVGIDARWAALMGQAYAARGEPDKALALFEKYLALISPQERALYEDLSLVASPEELKAYAATPDSERKAFVDRFWRKHDPLLTGGVSRRVEHYRRVWYARTYFGQEAYPWDRRGEVYIRYGEPDYRSRSGFPNAPPPPDVQLVKEKIDFQIYGYGAKPEGEVSEYATPQRLRNTSEQSPGRLWSWLEVRPDSLEYWRRPEDFDWEHGNARFVEPIFPIPRDDSGETRIPWESWVYTHVGGGIEFTFTDLTMNGKWDFALPPSGILNTALVVQMEHFNPGSVYQQVASETPEYFTAPPGVEPLPFYYDLAQFRGDVNHTDVEVYVGVPPNQVAIQNSAGSVVRTLVISNGEGDDVYRSKTTLHFAVNDTSTVRDGSFVPEVIPAMVPPGKYQLAVQVADQQSGKWGVYKQELEVPAFGDSLAMSDLELAYEVSSRPRAQQFRKGDVWVIPMPSRNYGKGQNPSVYYEVYNLARDDYGQTHYRVDYTIQQDVRKGAGMFGALSAGVHKLLASGKPQVVVGYERTSHAQWEPIYLELDMAKVKSGLNQLSVTVTDLVSGQVVSKRAMFQLSE